MSQLAFQIGPALFPYTPLSLQHCINIADIGLTLKRFVMLSGCILRQTFSKANSFLSWRTFSQLFLKIIIKCYFMHFTFFFRILKAVADTNCMPEAEKFICTLLFNPCSSSKLKVPCKKFCTGTVLFTFNLENQVFHTKMVSLYDLLGR